MDKKPLTGQHKWNLGTGETHIVASAATERVKEKQASLMEWAEDKAKLELWTAPDQTLDNNNPDN